MLDFYTSYVEQNSIKVVLGKRYYFAIRDRACRLMQNSIVAIVGESSLLSADIFVLFYLSASVSI